MTVETAVQWTVPGGPEPVNLTYQGRVVMTAGTDLSHEFAFHLE